MDEIMFVNSASFNVIEITASLKASQSTEIDFSLASPVSGTFKGDGAQLFLVTASFILEGSNTTSSYSLLSIAADSASWASSSLSSSFALTGPFTTLFTSSTYEITSSWANNSINSTSSSFLNGNATASLFGTSSDAVSSSYAITASFSLNAGGSGTTLFTGSTYEITSSWALNAVSASFATTFLSITQSTVVSASWASQSLSSSFSQTASFALNAGASTGTTYASNLLLMGG